MMTNTELLIKLAGTRFGHLSFPERELLRKVADGEEADYSVNEDLLNDPANASEWDECRIIQASLIVWLCTDPEANSSLTHRGLSIKGAKIEGPINLQFASLKIPLIFHNCAFTEQIRLDYSRVKFLDLSGSYVASNQFHFALGAFMPASLEARDIRVECDVFLGNGFKAIGGISLSGAIIGGNFDCQGGVFENPEGIALSLQSAEIKGNVNLSSGFKATGSVLLLGTTIGGFLNCINGVFENPKGIALSAQGAEIKIDANLGSGFKANGCVSLLGANIGGNFNCHGGVFENSEGDALIVSSAEIKGDVHLSNRFKATGGVLLLRATIGGFFNCINGKFKNPKDLLLALQVLRLRALFS